MMMRLYTLISSVLLPTLLLAAQDVESEYGERLTKAEEDSLARMFDLQEVVVTGTRTPKVLKDAPIQTRLISEQEIKRSDAGNIQDLLQQELPGIEFSYAMNQQVNMNLAGFAGQGVLVLLDGERLAGETMENTDFTRLNMNGVKRIEIIRGAASALYGSNAAGGVINIISKDADRPWTLSVNGRAADHHEWRAGLNLGLNSKNVSNMLDVTFNRISTYTVCIDTKDMCDFRQVYGYHAWNFRDRLIWRPADGLKLTARAGYYYKQRLYNPDTPDRYRDFSAGLKGEWDLNSSNRLELSYAFDQYDKSDFIRSSQMDVMDYRNVQNSLRALYIHTLREADVLTLGGDFMCDYLDTYQFGPGETHRQYMADIFAQYDWNISHHWELIGALRWDYFSDRDDRQVTGKLSARYRLDNLTLRGGYAGGFRAPTLKEKYMNFNMADIFDIHGNPDLKAEKSHNFNLSAEYSLLNYYFTLGASYNLVGNRISTSGIRYNQYGEPYIDYLNVPDLNVFSLDATVRANWLNGISASLSYNFTHEQTYGGSATQYCPARPHSIVAKCCWHKEWSKNYKTDVTLSGRFLSEVSYMSMYMYEPFEERRITNPAYTMWKLQLSQQICRGIQVTIAVDNLFNYSPAVYSFNAPVTAGTCLQVGLSLDIHSLVNKL